MNKKHSNRSQKLAVVVSQTLALANKMYPEHLQGLNYTVKMIKSIAPVLIEQMKRSKL